MKIIKNFFFFYKYLKYRLFVLIGLSILTGLLDGIGITLFLPLIESQGNFSATKNHQSGAVKFLFDALLQTGLEINLSNILLLILSVIVVKSMVIFLNSYFTVMYLQFLIKKLRIQSIDLLSNLNFQNYVQYDSGVIQNSLSGEVGRVVSSFTEYNKIIQNVLMAFTYVAFAYLMNPDFAILIIIGGVIFNFLYLGFFKRTKKLSAKLVKGNDTYQKLLLQMISYYKYLKATSTIFKYTQYMKTEINSIELTNRRMGVINSIISAFREPLLYSIVISVIIIQVNINHVALSSIMISLILFYRGLGIVFNIQNNYNYYLTYSASLENFKSFTANLIANKIKSGSEEFSQFKSQIRVDRLTYAYKDGEAVLKDVNFEINKNETVAFVGESGSGKSTLVNLLTGLLTPNTGNIYIDEISLEKYNLKTFQTKVGYITQDPVIFDDTVFNNVTLWDTKNEINLAKYQEALKQASIWEYFQNTEHQENTRLGNKGVRLSGGQIQRICIARELYKNVDFLFMDEATSALDSKTENIVKKNIESLQGFVTIIIVAHRLSTIKHADKIIVMNKGNVEAIGKFDELLEKSELFKSMINLQELRN